MRSDDDTSWLEGPAAARLSKRELGAITGLSPAKIEALIKQGMPCTPGATRRAGFSFDLKEIFAWFVTLEADPLAAARQRKVEAEAQRIETANLRAAGELIAVAEVRAEIAHGMSALRAAMLAIPARLADQSEEVKAAVRQEIVGAINAMSFTHGASDAAS